jgi:hypothetical protein
MSLSEEFYGTHGKYDEKNHLTFAFDSERGAATAGWLCKYIISGQRGFRTESAAIEPAMGTETAPS